MTKPLTEKDQLFRAVLRIMRLEQSREVSIPDAVIMEELGITAEALRARHKLVNRWTVMRCYFADGTTFYTMPYVDDVLTRDAGADR